MLFASSLLTTLLLALTVAASPVVIRNPPVTLKLSKRFNVTGTLNILQRDQARARVLRARGEARRNGKRAVVNEPVVNEATTYVVSRKQSVLCYGC